MSDGTETHARQSGRADVIEDRNLHAEGPQDTVGQNESVTMVWGSDPRHPLTHSGPFTIATLRPPPHPATPSDHLTLSTHPTLRPSPHPPHGPPSSPPHSPPPFALRTSQTRSGRIGISICVTPRCASASTTAFAIAGGAPTVADSPHPLRPQRMMRRWRHRMPRLPRRRLHRGRHEVVHKRPRLIVPILVVGHLLIQRGPQPLGQPTMDLPLHDHRVDDVPTVVHRHEPAHAHLTRAAINIHDADVRPERERQVRRVIVVRRLHPGLHSLRQVWYTPRTRSPGCSPTCPARPSPRTSRAPSPGPLRPPPADARRSSAPCP